MLRARRAWRSGARRPSRALRSRRRRRSIEADPRRVQRGATDFSVLPGESLAKYTRSNIQPLDEAEEEEIRDLQETDRRSGI